MKQFLIFCAIIFTPLMTIAQNSTTNGVTQTRQVGKDGFKDYLTFDLKGNVKKVTYDNKSREFDKNGKLMASENEKVLYDNEGRISEIKVEVNSLGGGSKYKYDSYGRVEFETIYLSVLGNTKEEKNHVFYNEKGQVVKIAYTNWLGEGVRTYSDYIYDNHGNWISRKENGTTIEKRSIEYY